MDQEKVRRIAEKIEELAVGKHAGRATHLRTLTRNLVDAVGGEHYVPTVKARLTEKGTYVVQYCPYCYRRHSHTSNTVRHMATCGRGEYILEVEK